jgi:hypothetical protein
MCIRLVRIIALFLVFMYGRFRFMLIVPVFVHLGDWGNVIQNKIMEYIFHFYLFVCFKTHSALTRHISNESRP